MRDAQESSRLHNPTIRGIAAGERREVLEMLITAGPLPESTLAERLSAPDRGLPEDAGRERTARTDLVHRHLPALEDAGLITWNREGGIAGPADHPALADPRFERLVETETEGLDDVLLCLAHEYRRIALTLLRDGQTAMGRGVLANEIRRCGDRGGTLDPATEGRIDTALHHAHLPMLSDVALVEYDPATGRVVYADDPVLEEVLTVIYGAEERTEDGYDEFLTGLGMPTGR